MVKADNTANKKWLWSSGMIFGVIYSLNCFVISPLITHLTADVVYADTAIPTLLGYLYEILELVAIAFSYSVLIMTLYRYGRKKCVGVFVLFTIATLYKYFANTLCTWLSDGGLPSLWGWDVVNVVFYTALELLQLFVIYLIVGRIITKFTDRRLAIERAIKKTLSTSETEEGSAASLTEKMRDPYPFEKVFDKDNCLLRSAFICGVVTLVAKLVVGALISDIWLILLSGIPQEGETWLLMIVNYTVKIILGAVTYFIIYISMSHLSKDIK